MLWTATAGRAHLAGMLGSGYLIFDLSTLPCRRWKEISTLAGREQHKYGGTTAIYFTVTISRSTWIKQTWLQPRRLVLPLSSPYSILSDHEAAIQAMADSFPSLPSHFSSFQATVCFLFKPMDHCAFTQMLLFFSLFPLLYFSKHPSSLPESSAALCPGLTLSKFFPTKSSHKTQRACYNTTPPRVLAPLPYLLLWSSLKAFSNKIPIQSGKF